MSIPNSQRFNKDKMVSFIYVPEVPLIIELKNKKCDILENVIIRTETNLFKSYEV